MPLLALHVERPDVVGLTYEYVELRRAFRIHQHHVFSVRESNQNEEQERTIPVDSLLKIGRVVDRFLLRLRKKT